MDISEVSGQGISDPTGNTGNVLHGPDAPPNPGFGSWFYPDFFLSSCLFFIWKEEKSVDSKTLWNFQNKIGDLGKKWNFLWIFFF